MLSLERIDVDSWAREIDNQPDRTVFQTPAWLSFVAETQNAEPVAAAVKEDRQIVGYFVGLIVRKFGLRILGSPFPGWTTSYMGVSLRSGVPRRDAVQALMRFAFKDLACVHLEFMDRQVTLEDLDGLSLQHKMFRSFEIDLTQSEDALFANMTGACRRCIRKAAKSGVNIEEAQDPEFAEDYYAQLQDVFAKQSLVPTYPLRRVQELIRHVLPTGMLLLLRARDPEGRCIATGIFPAMNRFMYFWGGASWSKYQILRPNEAIQWHAMKYWKQRGIARYDMGGGTAFYKRKYGGYTVSVPWFRKSKYRVIASLRSAAQRITALRQRLLGKVAPAPDAPS